MDDELDSELLDLVDNHDNPKSHDIHDSAPIMKPLDMETLPDNTGHFVHKGEILYRRGISIAKRARERDILHVTASLIKIFRFWK